jgi:hypothetical protein
MQLQRCRGNPNWAESNKNQPPLKRTLMPEMQSLLKPILLKDWKNIDKEDPKPIDPTILRQDIMKI